MMLRHTFTWSTVTLVLVAQSATVGLALYFASQDSQRRAHESLEVAYAVAESFLKERDHQLRTSVTVLAQDFALRKAIASGDLPTAQSALRNHASRIDADHAMLLSTEGAVLTATAGNFSVDRALWQQITARSDQLVTLADDAHMLYQVVVVPVKAPSLIGWVSMGFKVDEVLAHKIRSMTGTDVVFRPPDDPRPYATTSLPPTLAAADTLKLAKPLLTIGAPATLELSVSQRQALDAFFRLRNFTLWLSLAAVTAAALLGLALARRITRSLDALAAVARQVEVGNYAMQLPKVTGDEVARLGGALQTMQACIAQREAQIRHQAQHDSLTDLPNQEHARETLAGLLETDTGFTAIVAVVHGLNDVNSSLGLEFGDRAVQQIAATLSAGTVDYVARLSDTRFLLIVQGQDEAAVAELTRALHEKLALVSIAPEVQARFDASFGATFRTAGCDATSTIRRAWNASLEAVQRQRVLAWYTIDFSARRERRLTIMRDLRAPELEAQLSLLFQPKFDSRGRRYCGAEALLRWQHPTLGAVPVDEFIAVAEQTLDIQRVTRWVLDGAAAQISRWRRLDPAWHVAVNVSAQDLTGDKLIPVIRDVLRRHGLTGDALQVEVTEGALVTDLARATRNLEELAGLGVAIAIDDYGAGFSSLSQLRNLPADILKIDKSFVMKLNEGGNHHIVRSAIDLGHALGMKVVAEGVEDADAEAQLIRWGCDWLQGYHLSRPVPAARILELLEAQGRPAPAAARS